MAEKILVVDDEAAILELISYTLRKEGYQVVAAADGTTAFSLFQSERPDLVVLDVMLPGLDGLEVCRLIRRVSKTPILMLTAKKAEVDRVVGLEIGADDYVTKPFSPRELSARVKSLLRRQNWAKESADPAPDVIRFRELEIDEQTREVRVGGQPVELTFTQFELLLTLARSPGRVFSREELLERVWGHNFFGEMRTVDVHIRHLREKLEPDPAEPAYIKTVRGVGYRFGEKN